MKTCADSSVPQHHHWDLLADRHAAEPRGQLAEWGGTRERRFGVELHHRDVYLHLVSHVAHFRAIDII